MAAAADEVEPAAVEGGQRDRRGLDDVAVQARQDEESGNRGEDDDDGEDVERAREPAAQSVRRAPRVHRPAGSVAGKAPPATHPTDDANDPRAVRRHRRAHPSCDQQKRADLRNLR